jgi:hypothetical protein
MAFDPDGPRRRCHVGTRKSRSQGTRRSQAAAPCNAYDGETRMAPTHNESLLGRQITRVSPAASDRYRRGCSCDAAPKPFVSNLLPGRLLTPLHGRTTPCGTWTVTCCHNATSSLRASATIMVLRVAPRASAVRARYHWARALSLWNIKKRQATGSCHGAPGNCRPWTSPSPVPARRFHPARAVSPA